MKKRSTMIALLLAACTVMTSGVSTTVFAEEEHDPITVTWINSYNEDGISKWSEWVKEQVESEYTYITVDLQTV